MYPWCMYPWCLYPWCMYPWYIYSGYDAYIHDPWSAYMYAWCIYLCLYVWCTYQWSWPLILMLACVYDEHITILDPNTSIYLWCMCMRVRGVPWAWQSSRTRLGLIILIMGGKSFENCFLQGSDWSNLSINPSQTFERNSEGKKFPHKSQENTLSTHLQDEEEMVKALDKLASA